ncbi:TolC family protein [Thermotoga profunda]|uniref:TolC family protein n=1 Tax=Thermotoga profunda TaxID=1508420 RepID=UPI000596C52B|nr:TolC family protein [Thermotoga profunda]
MKKILILVFLVPVLSFAGFLDLIQEQLDKSSSYLSAVMTYKEAEFSLSKNRNVFIPYIGIDEFSVSTDFEDYTLSIPFFVKFQNIAGFDFTVSNGWTYSSKQGEWNDSGWAFTISRELFSNWDITDLENEEGYISASWNLIEARNKVFLNLANDIFNYHYYTRKLEVTKRKIEILEDQFNSLQKAYEAGTASKEDILQVQSSIYQATNQLDQISQNLMDALTEYSTDTLNTMLACLERITTTLPSEQEAQKLVMNRLDLKAQLIALEIAKRQSDRAYQEWLPNPTFSFKIKQDESSEKGYSFSLGFSFGYSILDRGEKNYTYNKLKDSYSLQQRILDEQLDNLKKAVQKAFLSIRIAESSKKVAELDLQLKKMEYENTLNASSFVSESDLESAKLNLDDAELEFLKTNYNLLIAKISLLQALGIDLVQLAGGK